MSFAIGTIDIGGGKTAPALRVGGEVYPLDVLAAASGLALPKSALEIFDHWVDVFPKLEELARGIRDRKWAVEGLAPASVTLGKPVESRKVFCVGANYADHLREMGDPAERRAGQRPFFYLKPPTALSAPGNAVWIPGGCNNFDWEVEMVVVFGKGGSNIPEDRALSHIAGYTLGIDFTSRDQFIDPELIFKFHFVLGKCQDRTAPIGPWIVPAAYLDGGNIDFSLDVNGVGKQSANTGSMLFSLAEQIAEVSRRVRIEPGDLMFTGSPAGVGLPRGEKLAPGDVVTARGREIGMLQVGIESAVTAYR